MYRVLKIGLLLGAFDFGPEVEEEKPHLLIHELVELSLGFGEVVDLRMLFELYADFLGN